MKLVKLLAMVILITGSIIGAVEAKTFKGVWDNNREWNSTLTLLDGNRVKYCFQSDCTVANYKGDPNKKIWFNWGRAKFYFRWDGKGYKGTRNSGTTKNRGYLE